jgi:hypothetical protein
MPPSGILCRVALLRTDVSEECIASITKVRRVGELGLTLAVTYQPKHAVCSSETTVLTRAIGSTSQKTAFFKNIFVTKLYNIWVNNRQLKCGKSETKSYLSTTSIYKTNCKLHPIFGRACCPLTGHVELTGQPLYGRRCCELHPSSEQTERCKLITMVDR